MWVLLLFARSAAAQSSGAAIVGRVVDASGSAVPSATVTARNLATGFRQSAISDASGAYRIGTLPAGAYDVTAEVAGFGTGLSSGVAVREGATAVANFTLRAPGVRARRRRRPRSRCRLGASKAPRP